MFNRVISTSCLAFASRRRDISFGVAFSCSSRVENFCRNLIAEIIEHANMISAVMKQIRKACI